jgi:large subunit ribosomal protein L14
MLQVESFVTISDNVGVAVGKCIHVYRGFYKKACAGIGDRILLSVRKKIARKDVKRKLFFGYVIRSRFGKRRRSGHILRFKTNSCVILADLETYKGTRIRGPVAAEFRFHLFRAIVSVSSCFL